MKRNKDKISLLSEVFGILNQPLSLLHPNGGPRLMTWLLGTAVLTAWLWHQGWDARLALLVSQAHPQTLAEVVRTPQFAAVQDTKLPSHTCQQVGTCTVEVLTISSAVVYPVSLTWELPQTLIRQAPEGHHFALTRNAFNRSEMTEKDMSNNEWTMMHIRKITVSETGQETLARQHRFSYGEQSDKVVLKEPNILLGVQRRDQDTWLGIPPGDGLSVVTHPSPEWIETIASVIDLDKRKELQFDALHLWPIPNTIRWEVPASQAQHLHVDQTLLLGYRPPTGEHAFPKTHAAAWVDPVISFKVAALTPEPNLKSVRILVNLESDEFKGNLWNRLGKIMMRSSYDSWAEIPWVLWPSWNGEMQKPWPLRVPLSALGLNQAPDDHQTTAHVWMVHQGEMWPVSVDLIGPATTHNPTETNTPSSEPHWIVQERVSTTGGWLQPSTSEWNIPWIKQLQARRLQAQAGLLNRTEIALYPQADWYPGIRIDRSIPLKLEGRP